MESVVSSFIGKGHLAVACLTLMTSKLSSQRAIYFDHCSQEDIELLS